VKSIAVTTIKTFLNLEPCVLSLLAAGHIISLDNGLCYSQVFPGVLSAELTGTHDN